MTDGDEGVGEGGEDVGDADGLSGSFAEELRRREATRRETTTTNPFDRTASGNAPKFAANAEERRRMGDDDQLAR